MEVNEEILTPEQVCELLHISLPTLRKWIMDDKIPYHKAGRQLRFLRSEILEWLKSN